jgi:hypothetical protein
MSLDKAAAELEAHGFVFLGIGLGRRPWHLAYIGCLLYLVALLPLPLFFRFVVLVTVHLYDPL